MSGDSNSINEKGPSLVGSSGLSWRYKIYLLCHGGSLQNIFLQLPYFYSFVHLALQAGQADVLGRLFLSSISGYIGDLRKDSLTEERMRQLKKNRK